MPLFALRRVAEGPRRVFAYLGRCGVFVSLQLVL